jgi:hypothetical protein
LDFDLFFGMFSLENGSRGIGVINPGMEFTTKTGTIFNFEYVFLVKQVPGRAPEQRESVKTVLYLLK